MVVLAPHGEVEKALPVVRLPTHKLLCLLMLLLVLNFFPQSLQTKHIATLLLNVVLFRCWQRLESLVTDIPGVKPLSLLCFVPQHSSHPATTWDHSQNRPQHLQVKVQMSTSLHVLLKDDPCLKGDAADGKSDTSAAYKLGQISVLQGRLTQWTTNMCLTRLVFLNKFLPQWRVTGDLVPQEAPHNS